MNFTPTILYIEPHILVMKERSEKDALYGEWPTLGYGIGSIVKYAPAKLMCISCSSPTLVCRQLSEPNVIVIVAVCLLAGHW